MEQEKRSHGALIGSIIIIIIILIGGLYIWQSKIKEVQMEKAKNAQMQKELTSAVDANELNSLQQDINSTDTNVGVDTTKIQ